MSKSRKIKIGIAAGIIVILAVAMIVMKGGKKARGGMPMGQEASVTVVRAEQPSSGDIILTTGLTVLWSLLMWFISMQRQQVMSRRYM